MEKNEAFILSLDIGTTTIKVGLFTTSGDLVHLATREQQLLFPQTNRVEQSLPKSWGLVCDATREVLFDINPSQVGTITTSCQRGSVVPLDRDGKPLTNLIVWMDNRGLSQVDRLHELVGNNNYYQTSGHPIVSITGVSKVLWLQQEAPEIWKNTAIICPPQTFFLKWLGCKEFVVDTSSGSYHFPCNIRNKVWSEEIAKAVDFSTEKLPRLVTATDIVGHLSEKAAKDMNLPSGIPLVAGGGDGQCAAAGAGIIAPGNLMINIGTAAGIQVFLSEPIFDPAQTLNCASHVVPGAWEMEGHTQASGTVLRWFRDEFGEAEMVQARQCHHDVYDLLINQADQAPPGSEGLVFLPTFNGSTAPIVDPHSKGAFVGLQLSHQRSHIIRSILEGISLEIRWMLDALIEIGVSVNEIRLSGGGSKNTIWNQIHADILNRPIRTVTNPDAALVGAAMCAAVALGLAPDFQVAAQNFVKLESPIYPRLENRQVYDKAYRHYVRLFKLLSEGSAFAE